MKRKYLSNITVKSEIADKVISQLKNKKPDKSTVAINAAAIQAEIIRKMIPPKLKKTGLKQSSLAQNGQNIIQLFKNASNENHDINLNLKKINYVSNLSLGSINSSKISNSKCT